AKTPLLIPRQAHLPQGGVSLHSGGPHERLGLELIAVRGLDESADDRLELRIELHLDIAGAQLLQRVTAELLPHFGKDLARRFDEHEPQILAPDGIEVLRLRAGHVLDLTERFDPREAAADEGEREHAPALLLIPDSGGALHHP